MRGPIDYILVGFEGNKFDGSILKAISEAIDKEIIELISLCLVQKDASGTVSMLDFENLEDEYILTFAQKYKPDNSHVSEEDIEEISDLINENTSVGLLVVEQVWAKPLKKALIDANGVLIADGRIHPDAAAELNN